MMWDLFHEHLEEEIETTMSAEGQKKYWGPDGEVQPCEAAGVVEWWHGL